jgi:tellurite resistance protein
MIILGTRGVTTSRGTGSFYCPQCQGQRIYEHKTVRRFFTLYFIPLIPLDLMGEYVECQTCRGAFDRSLLDADVATLRAAVQQEFYENVQRVLVLMTIADGAADEPELEALREFMEQIGAQPPSLEELARQVTLARDARTTAAEYARSIAAELSEEGKRLVARGAFLVATAGGHLHDSHRLQLERLPEALGLSEEEFREVISRASESA